MCYRRRERERARRRRHGGTPGVGRLIPQVVVLDPGDSVSWISDAGNLRVEFDSNRCPFHRTFFRRRWACAAERAARGGNKDGQLQIQPLVGNEQMVGRGEVILRDR